MTGSLTCQQSLFGLSKISRERGKRKEGRKAESGQRKDERGKRKDERRKTKEKRGKPKEERGKRKEEVLSVTKDGFVF